MNQIIETAISIAGSQKKLGAACGVSQGAVSKWLLNRSRVSPEVVNRLVIATDGKIKAYEIRPDLPDLFPPPALYPGRTCRNNRR